MNPNQFDKIDPYKILEVSKDASLTEIKKAYRALVLKHHPDKVKDENKKAASSRFAQIQDAYDILRDEETRREYDQYVKYQGARSSRTNDHTSSQHSSQANDHTRGRRGSKAHDHTRSRSSGQSYRSEGPPRHNGPFPGGPKRGRTYQEGPNPPPFYQTGGPTQPRGMSTLEYHDWLQIFDGMKISITYRLFWLRQDFESLFQDYKASGLFWKRSVDDWKAQNAFLAVDTALRMVENGAGCVTEQLMQLNTDSYRDELVTVRQAYDILFVDSARMTYVCDNAKAAWSLSRNSSGQLKWKAYGDLVHFLRSWAALTF